MGHAFEKIEDGVVWCSTCHHLHIDVRKFLGGNSDVDPSKAYGTVILGVIASFRKCFPGKRVAAYVIKGDVP